VTSAALSRIEAKLALLKCPRCADGASDLALEPDAIRCGSCGSRYPVVGEVPVFSSRPPRPADSRKVHGGRHGSVWRVRAHTAFGSVLWLAYLLAASVRERRNFFRSDLGLIPEVESWLPYRYYSTVPFVLYLKAREIDLFSRIPMESPSLEIGGGGGDMSRFAFAGKRIDVDCEYYVDNFAEFDRDDLHAVTDLHVGGSIYNLPLRDASFRTVVMVHIADHLMEIEAAFKELSRVLRPGGALVFTTYSRHVFDHLPLARLLHRVSDGLARWYQRRRCARWHLWRGAFPYIHPDPEEATGQNLFSVAEWTQLGARYDLTLEHVRPFTTTAWTTLMDLQHRSHPRFFLKPLWRFVSHVVRQERTRTPSLDEREAANLFLVFRRRAPA